MGFSRSTGSSPSDLRRTVAQALVTGVVDAHARFAVRMVDAGGAITPPRLRVAFRMHGTIRVRHARRGFAAMLRGTGLGRLGTVRV